MGSVLIPTKKYREIFPDDFSPETWPGDVQVIDNEQYKQFTRDKWHAKELDDKISGGFYEGDTDYISISGNIEQKKRKRSLIHELTHKVATSPDVFSKPLDANEIFEDTNKLKIENGYPEIPRKVLDRQRQLYKSQAEWSGLGIDKTMANESLAYKAQLFPKQMYNEPKTWYEKEFKNEFDKYNTRRRIFNPSLAEIELPRLEDDEMFYKPTKRKSSRLYELEESFFDQ